MSEHKGSLTLQKGKVARAQKAGIYGPAGVGKTTLGNSLPNPVFLDIEGGTDHLNLTRFPEVNTWEDITKAVAQLTTSEHDFKTLVIDTADWAEKRLAEHLCRKANKDSIEDFGYGKGYVILAEEFAKFLTSLDALLKRGMHVVFLAHSTVRKFESPDQAGSYDRFELKLTKQVAPLLKEWVDVLLFTNYVTKVAESDTGRKRGVGGKERAIYTTHSAAFDAKNRHGLEDKLPFGYDSIALVFGEVPAPAKAATKTLADQLTELFAGREEAVKSFLITRSQLKQGGSWADLPEDYAKRILAGSERFLQTVDQFITEGSK